jgi:predicted RNA-binding protein YlxR (DUF448 family)
VAPKAELIRIALAPQPGGGAREQSRAVVDRTGAMPGRGAYLCCAPDGRSPADACLARALRRRSIERGLRRNVRVDGKRVESVRS